MLLLAAALVSAGCAQEAKEKRAPRPQLHEETFYVRTGNEFRRTGDLVGVVVEGRDFTKPSQPTQRQEMYVPVPRRATNVTLNLSWPPQNAPELMWVALLAYERSIDINGRSTWRFSPVAEKEGPSTVTLTYSAAKLGYTSYYVKAEPRSDCVCDFTYQVTAHFWGPTTRNVQS